MMDFNTKISASLAKDQFTNVNSLDSVKAMGRDGDPEAMRKIAQQFESMFVHQLMKSMREANQVFGEDSLFNSSEMEFHQQMYDHQLALNLSEGKGIGLADVLYRQLMAAHGSQLKGAKPAVSHSSPLASNQAQSANYVLDDQTKPAQTARADASIETSVFDSVEGFIEALLPKAKAAAKALNTNPLVLLAQAALETGWGQHVISDSSGNSSHNLFNIKADQRWQGESVGVQTLEYRAGIAAKEQAQFRRYDNYAESFNDYVDFLKGSDRYRAALDVADKPEAFIAQLQRAGYATDPEYANKVMRVFNSEPLQRWAAELEGAD